MTFYSKQPHSVLIRAGIDAFLAGVHFLNNPYRDAETRTYWESGYRKAKRAHDRYVSTIKEGPVKFERVAEEKGGTAQQWYLRALADGQPFHPAVAERFVPPAPRPAQPRQQQRPQPQWKGKGGRKFDRRPEEQKQQPQSQLQKPGQGQQPKPQEKDRDRTQPRQFRNPIGQNLTREERRGLWATTKNYASKGEQRRTEAAVRPRP